MGRLRNSLLRLDGRDRALLLQAAFWLLVVDLGLRALGLARARALLGRVRRPRVRKGRDVPAGEAARLAYLVGVAARHHLYPMSCLRQALALQIVLGRRGIETTLCFGVRRVAERTCAHAWLEHAGQPIDPLPGGATRHVRLVPGAPGP